MVAGGLCNRHHHHGGFPQPGFLVHLPQLRVGGILPRAHLFHLPQDQAAVGVTWGFVWRRRSWRSWREELSNRKAGGGKRGGRTALKGVEKLALGAALHVLGEVLVCTRPVEHLVEPPGGSSGGRRSWAEQPQKRGGKRGGRGVVEEALFVCSAQTALKVAQGDSLVLLK